MSIQIEDLLKLPNETRRQIAEQLLDSLDQDFDEEELDEEELDEETKKILEERNKQIENGTATLLTQEQFEILLANRRKGVA